MKGIILSGGLGTRLYPLTKAVNKHLLPVYDKPMIYYPINLLMQCGIKEILLITSPQYVQGFENLLGDGRQWGVKIDYAEQNEPRGIADCFLVGKKYLQGNPCCLVLGDNLLHFPQYTSVLHRAKHTVSNKSGGAIFGKQVSNPKDYGIAEIDDMGNVLSIQEKPDFPRSNLAVPGLYFYDDSVVEKAESLEVSDRGELEITDLNKIYLDEGSLLLETLPDDVVWYDLGCPERLMQASMYVRDVQAKTRQTICSPDETARLNDWIDQNREVGYAQNF